MANNRLRAVCKDDNKCACLGKCYGLWSALSSPDKFFAEHENCSSNKGGGENIVWVDEYDERVILYDFSHRHEQKDEEGNFYYVQDNRIFFKGDEEKEWVKEYYALHK